MPIVPLERAQIPEVASIYERVMRSGSRTPAPGLAEYLQRTLLDHPWVDEEIPSLVSVDAEGRIVAFIGSHVRRMLLDGEPIRLACSGQLVADPDHGGMAVGGLLMRRYLSGPQDMSITDGATETVRRMWLALGAEVAHLGSLVWTRPLRGSRHQVDLLLRRLRQERMAGGLAARWSAFERRRAQRRAGAQSATAAAASEALSARALVEHLPTLAESAGWRLYPAYDAAFAEWLLAELAAVRARGRLVARLVTDARRGVLGWYLYYLVPGGVSQAIHVAAADADAGRVVDDLFGHARAGGTFAVQGRLEPRLLEPLALRRCDFRYDGEALIHARDPDLMGIALTRRALLTRMEGEWWMGHHLHEIPVSSA